MILNGSPRAPKSNSLRYAELFMKYSRQAADYYPITKTNHSRLLEKMAGYSDVLLVFPLYADALPVSLLNFLKSLEACPPPRKPIVSILINCGFLEHTQNEVAVRMLELFCRQNGYEMGSVLMLGSGEAILDTPFKYVAARAIRKLARAVDEGSRLRLAATMPLGPRLFKMAATVYWTRYGQRFGTSKKQMQTMEIEGDD